METLILNILTAWVAVVIVLAYYSYEYSN